MTLKHLVRSVIVSAACLCALLCVAACGSSKTDRPTLSVSVAPQKYLLSRLVGDLYDINVLIPSNADPETFDPSIGALTSLADSKYYFAVGAGGFEDPILSKIEQNFPKLPVLKTAADADLISGTHAEGDIDPHVWGSTRAPRQMAQAMTEALCTLDPANADTFRRNLASLTASLDSLDTVIETSLRTADKSFAIWHPSLSYFERDYGVEQIAIEQHGKEVTPSELRANLDKIKHAGAQVMFIEATQGEARAKSVAKDAGLKTATFNLNTEDWPTQLGRIVSTLSDQ